MPHPKDRTSALLPRWLAWGLEFVILWPAVSLAVAWPLEKLIRWYISSLASTAAPDARAVGSILLGLTPPIIYALILLWRFPAWQTCEPEDGDITSKDRVGFRIEHRRTLLQIIGGTAVIAGLYFTAQQLQLAREQYFGDKIARAAEYLSEDPPACIAGIYALEHIACDDRDGRERAQVMDLLAAFVRSRALRVAADVAAGGGIRDAADKPADEWKPVVEMAIRKIGAIKRLAAVASPTEVAGATKRLDLRSVDLRYMNLAGLNLVGVDLHDADLRNSALQGTDFSHADLGGAYLDGAFVEMPSDDANAPSVCFAGAHLQEAYLRNVKLGGANFANANLRSAKLGGADLRHARFEGADLRRVQSDQPVCLYGAHFDQRSNLRSATLDNAELTLAVLVGADLQRASLCGAILTDAKTQGADLRHANLDGARLDTFGLGDARIYGAQVRGAVLSWAPDKVDDSRRLRVDQLQELLGDADTVLPDNWVRPSFWQ